MDRAPLVSVCIPTYNGSAYLSECIACVRAQSFSDFEVVICDDQSSDGTLELARRLAGDDTRFRFMANPRRFGLVGNWNNCVQQARGEWIKFLFQDDTMAPTCLEKLLDACRTHNKPLGFCERTLLFEDGTSPQLRDWFLEHKEQIRETWQSQPVIEPERAVPILERDIELNLIGEPSATIIKKSIFAELGAFHEELIQACDLEFWLRVLVNYGAVFVPEVLAGFRVHAQATTAVNRTKHEYRAKILDSLLVRYDLAFGRHYKKMRRLGGAPRGTSMRLDCMMFAAYAGRQARNRAFAHDVPGENFENEWRAFLSRHFGLRMLAALGTAVHHSRNFARSVGAIKL